MFLLPQEDVRSKLDPASGGSLFRHPKYSVPYCLRDPKKDHNFDNHPFSNSSFSTGGSCCASVPCLGLAGVGFSVSCLWLVANGRMGFNYSYYYYHSSIPY